MATFKDSGGNTWNIELPFGLVVNIRKQAPRFNLLEPSKHDLYKTLHRDLVEFWELLWYIVEEQAVARSIDAVQFGKLMSAECLLVAHKVFMQEWADFFRKLQRENEAVALEKLAAYQETGIKLVKARLASPEMAHLDKMTEQAMEEALNKSFGELRESLGSTQDPSPSGN